MRVSFQTSLIQGVGICVCGFAIKKSDNELIFATSILIYSLIHFILGLIIYSNPIASNKLILLYEKSSSLLASCLYAPLLNVQLLSLYNADYWQLKNIIIITSSSLALFIIIEKCWKLFLDVFITTQCVLLMYLSMRFDSENFWIHSLSILIFLNYFAIPEMTRRYSVPKHELMSVSLIFQNIFLVNSVF